MSKSRELPITYQIGESLHLELGWLNPIRSFDEETDSRIWDVYSGRLRITEESVILEQCRHNVGINYETIVEIPLEDPQLISQLQYAWCNRPF